VCFGPFRLVVGERLLVKKGEPVALGGRSFDILIALLERPGEVVSHRDLMQRVWPDVRVEEVNLRVNVANLRKALGDGADGARYIDNVPGRGYCFVAPVDRAAGHERPPAPASPLTKSPKLPRPLARMVGRDETVSALCSLIMSRRFVSIVGSGGIGKTTVAIAMAYALLEDFGEAVCFVDLGAFTNAALVAGAVSSALDGSNQARDPVPGLVAFLADRRVLVILDNCEHVIEAAAALAERLFAEAPLVYLLATSREALRVEGENVHLLLPLDTPLDQPALTAADALASPAVQVFMERAAASGYRSELTDADAPTVAEICRRLDGVALAIELAGSRVGSYGIRGTAELLDQGFKLLSQGRRSALPRHQTLQAMIDWSYNLLSEFEKTILCRLGAFICYFTLEGALSVACDTGAEATIVAEALASLVGKSLVWTYDLGGSTYYRLPDMTRLYAAAKLADRGEGGQTARRHALYYTDLLKPETTKASVFVEDVSRYAPHLENVRAALEWCFSGTGDAAIGIELSGRSAPLFARLSLLRECERWCDRAVAALPEEDRGTQRELALREALAMSSMYTRGNSDEVRVAIERGLALAEALGDCRHQLRLLASLHIFLTRICSHRAALEISERSATVARAAGDSTGIVIAEWMLGVTHHLLGNQAAAQHHCERGFELSAATRHVYIDVFGYDHHVRALIILARTQWLRGRPERALALAHQSIEEAARRDHPIAVCLALIYTIPVFFWTGEVEAAEESAERLIARATKHSLGPYHALGLALKGEVLIAHGEPGAGVQLLRGALATLQAERQHILSRGTRRALAEGLARCGAFDDARAAIDEALALAEQDDGRFDMPDLLRARAEILLAGPQPDVSAAEASLVRSLEWAREQSALGWELRAAIQLARLWAQHGNYDRARDLLADVYERFAEGFETADMKIARRLLAELQARGPHRPVR
jgi:predicted ATPase/DNA-binding winged helix-turn-helix (wHTH) protein